MKSGPFGVELKVAGPVFVENRVRGAVRDVDPSPVAGHEFERKGLGDIDGIGGDRQGREGGARKPGSLHPPTGRVIERIPVVERPGDEDPGLGQFGLAPIG